MDDKENEAIHRRKPADESENAESPAASDSSERVVRARKPSRQAIEAGILKAPTAPLPPMKVSPAVLARRVPSYPAWEKPPSPYLYPQLRGREQHRPLKPLLLAATGVAIVLIAVVVVPALLGHGWGGNPGTTASKSPSASHIAVASGKTPGASPSVTSTPAGPTVYVSYQQYKVLAGDSVARIAAKFHLRQWELLLANPKITNPTLLKVGSTINIPQPGQLTQPPPTQAPSPSAS